MYKTRTANEVESVRAFWNPELGIRGCTCCLPCGAQPYIFSCRQGVPDDVAFLALDSVLGLLRKRGAVSDFQLALLEQKTMVGGNQHRTGVEVHEDLASQLSQFLNGHLDVVERVRLGWATTVATVVDDVVIDVDQLLIFQCVSTFIP
ncbi:hypothetical protein D3C81_1770700 [compost metagenome]